LFLFSTFLRAWKQLRGPSWLTLNGLQEVKGARGQVRFRTIAEIAAAQLVARSRAFVAAN
jgi:hypothetical protein